MEDAAHKLGKYSIEFAGIKRVKRRASGLKSYHLEFRQILRQFAG